MYISHTIEQKCCNVHQLLLHLILFERHYTKRDKNLFFVLARCPCTTSESYNVVTARYARCTNTRGSAVYSLHGPQVITLLAKTLRTIQHRAAPHHIRAPAIFGLAVLSTSPSVIYYSPVIDQRESP